MKRSIKKAAGILAGSMILAFGSASAQLQTPPPSGCSADGVMGSVDYDWGQRVFMCQSGEWRFMYECQYDASGNCIIL